jgi:Uma2 family endonuclease
VYNHTQLNDLWQRVLSIIKNEITEVGFNTWIAVIEPVLIDNKRTIILKVPNDYFKYVVDNRYSSLIKAAFLKTTSCQYEIIVMTSNEAEKYFDNCMESTQHAISETSNSYLNSKYTYEDYLSWPEDKRWEILDGRVYVQSAPSRIHQEVSGEIFVQIHNYLKDKPCRVYHAPFSVRLPKGNEKDEKDIKTVVEPDITIVCDNSKLDDRGCKGAPDMIVEILSPSSVQLDRLEKFNKYEQAGVKEYWIVEPEGKIVSVFVLGENNRYGRPEVYSEKDRVRVSLFDDLTIDFKMIFNRE